MELWLRERLRCETFQRMCQFIKEQWSLHVENLESLVLQPKCLKMIDSPTPARAEASDVANGISKVDAAMLSAESAVEIVLKSL